MAPHFFSRHVRSQLDLHHRCEAVVFVVSSNATRDTAKCDFMRQIGGRNCNPCTRERRYRAPVGAASLNADDVLSKNQYMNGLVSDDRGNTTAEHLPDINTTRPALEMEVKLGSPPLCPNPASTEVR